MTHTKGPWNADNGTALYITGNTTDSFNVHVVQGENEDCIAYVYELEDARLIAAAPDLLEALKDALEALETSLEHDDPQASTQMEWEQEPLPTIRAAITKAEGRTP